MSVITKGYRSLVAPGKSITSEVRLLEGSYAKSTQQPLKISLRCSSPQPIAPIFRPQSKMSRVLPPQPNDD